MLIVCLIYENPFDIEHHAAVFMIQIRFFYEYVKKFTNLPIFAASQVNTDISIYYKQ